MFQQLLKPLLLAACLAGLATPVAAQQRAYAPENLRTLSHSDQVRVISLEYQEQSRGRRIPDDQLRFYLDQVNRSSWGFSRIKSDIAQSLGNGGGNGGVQPPYPNPGQTLRCDSNDGDTKRCTPPWRGPSRLVRQVSKNPCVENRTWNSQDGLIMVWKGCRGEFAAATRPPISPPVVPPPATGVVRCESVNNQAQTCRVPWSGPSRLSRQLSGTACREGVTWQSQRGQVYVGGGCRAEFVSAAAVQPPVGGGSGGPSVVCASTNNQPAGCPWPAGTGAPRLLQQLSSQPCIQNRTWGFTGTAIWVSHNCRGRFGY
ncbi:DUF3011 domain-containing protein [Lysobacter cavernae]|uniref:DUF3011 domain-containing protein n=1 Tax=Lysobacter cavernae TaxID=1685901 RepID=A0ABV7RPQ3_9GAMM